MNRYDKKVLEVNHFKRIPLQRFKRALPRPTYYKIECLDCDLIISVRWERQYTGPTRTQNALLNPICSFCEGSHTKQFKINEQEYSEINQQWDAITFAETTDQFSND
ncbi:MAG: hypothetical protein DRR16_04185 [Candidatus Parabeggiatoa sp. nov. 3]|jgi:hypothetical protein|nr:MAG: hypothetical protein DRR00_08225 [Gammaproteobacteria bacterium]RKZ67489.1 MAG: hypothetical protein DRQ99_06535 [Gammaproteobacteria bacterium]RKZ88794.1 MAG: hypothetical protein DRR16_04185 [Gammaproteobacteria bacterium]